MHTLIGLLSDAHGNEPAFTRAIRVLLARGAEHFFFLGDAIGYVPSPAVLDAVSVLGDRIQCIRGNHEAMLLDGEVDSASDRVYRLECLRPLLSAERLKMIASWPTSRTEVIDGQKVLLVHGSPADVTYGYIYPDTDLAEFSPSEEWVFMGNTHYPFIREQNGVRYVNIGSCGMPRDDGRYGSVALLDTRARSVQILRFDITEECHRVFQQFPMIHPSVREVYKRRRHVVVGDIL
jgi:putative phosphoesterase